jgi:hypothetical protein
MNKHTVHQLILDKLRVDLDIAERAAQTAYETATHEENIAENKYDTLGLEASYLAAGQAKRVEEIRQSLALCQNLMRAYDEQRGIESAHCSAWKTKRVASNGCFWHRMRRA